MASMRWKEGGVELSVAWIVGNKFNKLLKRNGFLLETCVRQTYVALAPKRVKEILFSAKLILLNQRLPILHQERVKLWGLRMPCPKQNTGKKCQNS